MFESVDIINNLLTKLFPVYRSITGNGVRETYKILSSIIPFNIFEINSGEKCFDWTIPKEWNIKDAWIKDNEGNKIINFQNSNIHVVGYSTPIKKRISFTELKNHLFTLPHLPDAIPYRTSYYKESWGFCLSHNQLLSMNPDIEYEIFIDSSLEPGSLSYGEKIINPGGKKEFLISTYSCHPSLANDNLSGVILWTMLLLKLSSQNLKFSYRFIIIPETIGALAYASRNLNELQNVEAGLVITTVGGPGSFGYKESFEKNGVIDFLSRKALKNSSKDFIEYPFDINGSDERQFSTPGIKIPTGSITKDKYYEYPFYHTSLDNLDFVKAENIAESLTIYLNVIDSLERCVWYRSKNTCGEPMLSKRGLHAAVGGSLNVYGSNKGENKTLSELSCVNWLMFYGDGRHTVEDVSDKLNVEYEELLLVFEKLEKHDLVERI